MAKRGFLVSFAGTAGDPPVHRVRDWAEELLDALRRNGWGDVENADTATDKVWVTASSARALGGVAGALKRTLRRHNLLEEAVVTKLTEQE